MCRHNNHPILMKCLQETIAKVMLNASDVLDSLMLGLVVCTSHCS